MGHHEVKGHDTCLLVHVNSGACHFYSEERGACVNILYSENKNICKDTEKKYCLILVLKKTYFCLFFKGFI